VFLNQRSDTRLPLLGPQPATARRKSRPDQGHSPSGCPSSVSALVLGRGVGKGEAHKSATVDDKMKVSHGKYF